MNALESFIDDNESAARTAFRLYRIEGEIGRGGMGAVYEAVRADNEYQQARSDQSWSSGHGY
jgi:hypothetical protein